MVSELSEILLDGEPNLLEIKRVFQVFDENKDGFIDMRASENPLWARSVLKEGSQLKECRRIGDGDELLDYDKFVAFMNQVFLLIFLYSFFFLTSKSLC